mgnify:FL=1
MIQSIRLVFLLASLVLSFFVNASYTMTELEGTPLEVPDTVNTVVWDNLDTSYPNDDDKQVIVLDFPFQFDSVSYPALTIFTNGIIKFLPTERMHRVFSNNSLPTSSGDNFLAVYWDDLVDDASSSVTYGTLGTAPNRKFIVNWSNVRSYAGNLRYDFQVVLYENGDIRYRYNNNTSNGQSATIGLEINDADFIQYSYNSVSVEVSFDLFFRNELLALPASIAEYRFDETSWDGSAGEVADSSTNGLSGQSYFNANTSDLAPALGSNIGTCNYGTFDGISDYVEIADDPLFDLSSNFSVGVWIKIDSLPGSGLKTIVSKDDNFEFHVTPSGNINWWWKTTATAALSIVRQLNSTTSIVPGEWTHVVISFATLTQTIFINGVEAGSDIYPEEAITNSLPLQIAADQGAGGRYFNGSIDEVNVFDQALTVNQARELMEKTRPCPSFNLCVSSFPDGLNSHTGGDINFGENAQLFFSPTDSLYAGNVSLTGGSFKRSCVSVECQANGLAVEPTVPASFPNTASNINNVTVNNNASGSIGGSENDYKNVSAGDNSTINVVSGYSNYYIDDLTIGNDATLNLTAGTYWINNFTAGNGLDITITGGTARVYINNTFSLARNSIINSPSADTQGDASLLLLYAYNSIITETEITFSGVIYAENNVVLDTDSQYFGAITAADIDIGDDTKIFYNPSAAANLNYGDLCKSASCTLGSFNIEQPDYALACPGTRSKISIQAMCDDGTSPKEDYAGTVDLSTNENALSEFYATLVSTPTISSLVFDGTELGTKDAYLFHQNENATLYVSAEDTVEGVASTSLSPTDFRTEGFTITAPASFTCGGASSLRLTAIGEDDTGVACQTLTGFTGSKDLKAWYSVNIDSDSGADVVTTDLLLDSQAISDQSEPAANNLTLTFNSGIADVDIGYPNAGNVLGINFKHDDAPYDGSIAEFSELVASSTDFVVKPNLINLSIADANASCATGMVNETCSKFVAAGAPFVLSSEAQCIGGGTADDYQGSIALTHGLVSPIPSAGSAGSLAINSATFGSADGGAIQMNNQSISEVGVFSITATPSTYYGETIAPFTLPTVGRFYPDHFILTSSSTSDSCSGFSYMGQTDSEIDISYTVQAQRFGGGVVLNYNGAFAKASISLVAENNNDGGGYQTRLSGFNSTSWSNGEYLYSDGGIFTRAPSGLPDGPYQDLDVGILLADNDGNVSVLNALDMRADTITDCSGLGNCNAKNLDTANSLDIRFGQLKLGNIFGPETFDLNMAVRTEYYDGTDFVLNTDDSCTVLLDTDPPLTPQTGSWTGNLSTGETFATLSSNISSGVGEITFDAAGLGNSGSVIYEYDTINNLPWLSIENDGDADYGDNPFGKITFGQFRGNDRVIYWREIVR